MAAIAVVAVAAWTARWSPVADTIGQLAAPALAVAAGLILLALARRRIPEALGTCALGLLLIVVLAPQLARSAAPPARARAVRIYVNNIWVKNHNAAQIVRSIRDAHADIVALVQVSDANARPVAAALADYPFQSVSRIPSGERGKTLIASRFPLISAEPSCRAWRTPPGFEVAVAAPTPIRLILVHMPRPWPFPGGGQVRQYSRLAEQVRRGGDADRTVIVGDFNATLSSAVMRRFLAETGLEALPAIIGDWPSFLPGPLRIALENALAGRGLVLRDRTLAPKNGSDHQPLVFEVAAQRTTGAALGHAAGRPACFP